MVLIDEAYLESRFGVSHRKGGLKTSADSSESGSCHESGSWAEESSAQLAWKKLMRLLSVRDRSVKECRTKLQESEFSPADIDSAVAKALRLRLLDDMRFADSLVRAKVSAGKGLRGIESLLVEHDITPSSLEGFPADYVDGLGSEFERACRFMERHPTRSKNPWKSAYGKLLRAGYDSDSAYRASSWWSNQSRE